MATIRKRTLGDGSMRYQVQVRIQGQPQQSASFERLVDARKWAEQVQAGLRTGRIRPEMGQVHSVHDMIDQYRSNILPQKPLQAIRVRGRHLDWWDQHLGQLSLGEITPGMVARARDRLAGTRTHKGTSIQPATVNRYLATLSHVFTIAVQEWEWLPENPLRRVRKMKEPRGRVRYLDAGERGLLLAECQASKNPILHTVVLVGLSSGMRRKEVMGLRWNRVDLERSRVVVLDTKNGEPRGIPLTGQAVGALRGHLEASHTASTWRQQGLVFPSPKDSSRPYDIQSAWKAALQRAGIDNFRFHDLRHCTASYLAMSGASLAEIAEVLGHKTLAMVKRYAHISESRTAEVMERMSEKFLEAGSEAGQGKGDRQDMGDRGADEGRVGTRGGAGRSTGRKMPTKKGRGKRGRA